MQVHELLVKYKVGRKAIREEVFPNSSVNPRKKALVVEANASTTVVGVAGKIPQTLGRAATAEKYARGTLGTAARTADDEHRAGRHFGNTGAQFAHGDM